MIERAVESRMKIVNLANSSDLPNHTISEGKMETIIERSGYRILLSEPELYVNNEARGRSGHMSHAMAEFAPSRVIDFNSNCSAVRCRGHSAFGWIEYRISNDGGEHFGEARELPYSKRAFFDGVFTVSVEKAVVCPDGSIVIFALRNTTLASVCCEPWLTPMVLKSTDGGDTWSTPAECSPYKGRIYDAVERGGVIYMLQFCNDGEIKFTGNREEHRYRLFVSYDNGESFTVRSELPGNTEGRGYGSLLFDSQGILHAYTYNVNAEREMDHLISRNNGETWELCDPCYLAKGIRNPQTALIDGVYILHGRGEKERGFVIYSSPDGYTWDEGYSPETEKRLCYYSNNIVLKDSNGDNRLLIQYSDAYKEACVNVMHRWLRIQRKEND